MEEMHGYCCDDQGYCSDYKLDWASLFLRLGVLIQLHSHGLRRWTSELEIAQVRILSVTVALFISIIELVLYSTLPLILILFDKILAQASSP
ncbi:hypothetical protein J6590_079467 [Homalodisca vitripennis]|nr:hypothetical protein J6590_079467 [Homalodisca vitripennis]